MFGVISFTVLVESFVEFSKSIGDSFSVGDALTFFVLYFCDENSLFFAVLILRISWIPLNASTILSMSCCLFILFFL